MAATGGRFPFDKKGALTGPARVLWAPITQAIPVDIYDVVPGKADGSGEYPALSGWNDFGLAADAPQYSHSKDTDGLEYQNVPGNLFETVSSIERSFSAQCAQIDAATLKIIENTTDATAIALGSAGSGEAAQTKIRFGLYNSLIQYRIAMISYRPQGADDVTEPAPSNRVRPAAVALILPRVQLSADSTDLDFSRGDPTNAEVGFEVFPETTLAAGFEHGFWAIETGAVLV